MTIAVYKHEWNNNDDYNCHQCNCVAMCPSIELARKYVKNQNDDIYYGKDGNKYPYYVIADFNTRERIEL